MACIPAYRAHCIVMLNVAMEDSQIKLQQTVTFLDVANPKYVISSPKIAEVCKKYFDVLHNENWFKNKNVSHGYKIDCSYFSYH